MVGEFGSRALAWKRCLGRSWQGFFLRRRTLGEWRAKLQNLVGFGTVVRFRLGCNREQPGWLRRLQNPPDSSGSYLNGRYGPSLLNPSGLVWVR